MPYLVIDAARAIVSGGILSSQTAADTLAATVTAWTAHSGDVTGSDFHADTVPGWFLTAAGATVAEPPITTLQALKNVMSEAHHYLMTLQDALHAEGSARPWTEVVTVHNYFARVHQSNYRIVKDNPIPLTVAQRTAYATALLAGPQASGARLTVSSLFDALIASSTLLGVVQGVTYVNPTSGAQLTIATSLSDTDSRRDWGLGESGSPLVVSEAQLVSGLWVEAITT